MTARRLALLTSTIAFACTSGDDDGDTLGDGPLYLASSWVSGVDATHTYVAVIDSLDVEELDLSNAVEVPGWGDAWVADGAVFVSDGETPNVSRYELAEDGTLELQAEIGFGSYGVGGAAFWDQQILTPTKAWLSDSAGKQYIEWNPTTMEITGTVAWPDVTFDDGLDVFHSYTDRGGVVIGDQFFHGLYGHSEGWDFFGDKSYIAVWDIPSGTLVETIEVPCPMMDVASLGDDGFIYVSGWSYMPLSMGAGYSDTNCAARIDASTHAIDTDWTFSFTAVTDGDEGSGLRAVAGTEGIFAAFHGTDVPVTDDMDIWALDAGENDWELYALDLETKAATPTGIQMGDGSYYESHIDDSYYVYLPGNGGTQVYERTDDGYEAKLSAPGWMSRLFRLR